MTFSAASSVDYGVGDLQVYLRKKTLFTDRDQIHVDNIMWPSLTATGRKAVVAHDSRTCSNAPHGIEN